MKWKRKGKQVFAMMLAVATLLSGCAPNGIVFVLKKFFILIKDSLRQKATLLPDCFISQTVTNLQDRSRNRQPLLASHHH